MKESMTTYEDSLSLKSTLEDAILELSGNKSMSKEFLEDIYVTDFLKEQKINQLSKVDLLEALKKLNEKLGQIKPIDLTVAVEPDDKFKKSVVSWFSKNIKTPVLPRYTMDSALVGGAKITYNGNFLDLSLRNKIDELPFFKRKI